MEEGTKSSMLKNKAKTTGMILRRWKEYREQRGNRGDDKVNRREFKELEVD